jgi:hypothetical protein
MSMNCRKQLFALGGTMLLGLAGVVHADTTPASTDVQAEVAALRARVNELEGKQSENWLNERRATEVKALVKEVLADADTRASLLEGGSVAGHNGKNFFLASEDGNYLMNVSGNLQPRYIWNSRHNTGPSDPTPPGATSANDNDENGFEISRAQVALSGHVVNPAWTYMIRFNVQQGAEESGTVGVAEIATIGYQVTDQLNVRVGRAKDPFTRESMVDDMYQLAVDRSVADAIFGAGYVEGIFAAYDINDMIHLQATIDDGNHSAGTSFNTDATDLAVGARIDIKLAGDWAQARDFAAWSGEEMGLFVGGGARYIWGETGDANFTNENGLDYTADAQFEMAGFNALASFTGFSAEADPNGTTDSYAAVIQAGYMIIPDKLEPFGRYEWIKQDTNPGSEETNILTAGVNYYIAKQAVKVTIDVVYAFDALTATNGTAVQNLGLLSSASSDQFALRAQVQLMF